jgi:hypothetical protein
MTVTKNTKNIAIIGLILAIAGIGGYFYMQSQVVPTLSTDIQTVNNKDISLEFVYGGGDTGFTLSQSAAPDGNLLKAYVLTSTKDYKEFQENKDDRETPPAISAFVYQLEDEVAASTSERVERITRLQNWAMDNDALTSISKAKNTPDIVELDGLKALHYQADGLYQQDVYLASYKNRVYMFVGQYDSEKDITYIGFQDFIQKISFL